MSLYDAYHAAIAERDETQEAFFDESDLDVALDLGQRVLELDEVIAVEYQKLMMWALSYTVE